MIVILGHPHTPPILGEPAGDVWGHSDNDFEQNVGQRLSPRGAPPAQNHFRTQELGNAGGFTEVREIS
jgi:hypothetical protein